MIQSVFVCYLALKNNSTIIIMIRLLFSFIFFFILLACNNEARYKKGAPITSIFFDYKIRGEEKDSNITVYIQYRNGGPNGSTLVLNEPAQVELDGEVVPVDSARLTGAFYEIQKPSADFAGRHTIVFTDLDKKEFTEHFDYHPFSLRTNTPATVTRGDLAFDLEGLGTEEYLRVTATDTSFASKDIIEIDTVKNGRLIIPAAKLKALVNGPITFLLSKETERAVKNGTREGGRIVVNYGLERVFELTD
jgi:hypothetical protein